MLAQDGAVVREVALAIRGLHKRGIGYAEIFSPLHDDGLADAIRRSTILMRIEELGRHELELVTPPIYGRYIMTIAAGLDARRRGFAARHGLGHVVAGHVSELTFLATSTRDYATHEERVADVFALADLAPFWMLDDLRKARTAWCGIKQALCRIIRQHTLDWPEDRVFDRASLRLTLYREYGL